MTLLSIIQDCANEVGVLAPVSVINNADANTVRMLQLSNRGGKSIAQRFAWQEMTQEFTFATVAAEVQGQISTLMPGFNFDLYQSIWNRDTRLPLAGPLFPSEWQFLKALNISGPYTQFRVRGNNLLCIPIPTAGQIIAGEYLSTYWCQSAGGTGQDRWMNDTDTGILREDLLTLDLVWRWKAARGLDYSEEKQEFEIQVNNAMSRNGNNRIMSLEGDPTEYPNGIGVQQGNWPLT